MWFRTQPKPIILNLRRRKVPASARSTFQVKNLRNFWEAKDLKDLLLLSPTITFSEIMQLLIQRARSRGVILADDGGEVVESALVSVSTNHRKLISDVVGLDKESWEAGRELLLTREDAILRLDVAQVEGKRVGEGEGGRCVVQ